MVDLIVLEKFEITGKGTVLTISLAQNNINYYPKLVGRLMEYEGLVYRILSIDLNLTSTLIPRGKDIIALIVKEEPTQDNRFIYKELV